jgi:hypothetical protein
VCCGAEFEVVRQLWGGVKRLSRRLFGWPRPTTIYATLGTALEVNFAGSARGVVQFGPLPDPAQDPDAFKAAVEDRLNRVHELAQDVQQELGPVWSSDHDSVDRLRTEARS